MSPVFDDVVNPSQAGGGFSRTRGPSLLPSWRRRAPHQMFICLRGTFSEKGDWVSGEAAEQRGRRAESRACYVLARSLCFHCHRLSSTSSAPSSDVFLSARYDDSSSVDFSHCRPLFPGLFALPLFVSLAGGLTESCSLTFPSYGPCYRCLNPHKRLLSWAWCQPGSPPFSQEPGRFLIQSWLILPFLRVNLRVAMGPADTGLGHLLGGYPVGRKRLTVARVQPECTFSMFYLCHHFWAFHSKNPRKLLLKMDIHLTVSQKVN